MVWAGAREVRIIEGPIAAAMGSGIDTSRPCGNMIVDIGAGTCDVAVISLDGIVVSSSVKVAGDNFDQDIVRYMKQKYDMMVGKRWRRISRLKSVRVFQKPEQKMMEVLGRDVITGLPKTVRVTSEDTRDAIERLHRTDCGCCAKRFGENTA